MFPRPEIASRLGRFVRVRLSINDRRPATQSARWARLLRDRFGTSAIPLYAALSPKDVELGKLTFPGGSLDAFAAKMETWLDAMLAKAEGK